jgi:hypothetical protein
VEWIEADPRLRDLLAADRQVDAGPIEADRLDLAGSLGPRAVKKSSKAAVNRSLPAQTTAPVSWSATTVTQASARAA